MSKERKLQIRNSTAEFLIFSKQAGENSIKVRVENETVWLTQKLLALLFEADVRTINEHLGNIYKKGGSFKKIVMPEMFYPASMHFKQLEPGFRPEPCRNDKFTDFCKRLKGLWIILLTVKGCIDISIKLDKSFA